MTRSSLKKWAGQFLLRSESFPGKTIVELSDYNRMLVENYRNVTCFSSEMVELEVSFGIVQICGAGLVLDYLEKDRVLITGTIDAIQVQRGA